MTSATVPKKILLGGANTQTQREGVATAVITPGMLIDVNDGQELGANANVAPHAGADLVAQSAWAVEYDLTGRGIDDDYQIGDQVVYEILEEGAAVYAILAAGQNVADGALLSSNGDGRLKAVAATGNVVARAREAVNATAAAARIRVEVMRGKRT